jgi:glutaredoxin
MSAATTGPRVTLYSKPGCHLCDDARVVVEQVCAELGESYVEVDITAGPDAELLTARYGEEIPVTLVDGRQHDFWRVDPDRLREALTPAG